MNAGLIGGGKFIPGGGKLPAICGGGCAKFIPGGGWAKFIIAGGGCANGLLAIFPALNAATKLQKYC